MSTRYEPDRGAERRFEELNGDLLDRILNAVDEDATRYAPVLTGELRNSIGHKRTSPTRGIVFANEEYAAAQENGFIHHRSGRHVPAQPYLRPALYKNQDLA